MPSEIPTTAVAMMKVSVVAVWLEITAASKPSTTSVTAPTISAESAHDRGAELGGAEGRPRLDRAPAARCRRRGRRRET